MYVFEIIQPGTWLSYEDRDWSWQVEKVLRQLVDHFFTANAALNLYVQSRAACTSASDHIAAAEAEAPVLERIRQQVMAELGIPPYTSYDVIAVGQEASRRLNRSKWLAGVVPVDFELTHVFIHAEAFILALDAFEKALGVLERMPGVPPQLSEMHAEFLDRFPALRGIRNTLQHVEDRSRGLGAGRNPQPMTVHPIDNGHIKTAGGIVSTGILTNNTFGSTMSDGHFGEIAVEPSSLEIVANLLQATLEAFSWSGPKTYLPRG